MISAQASLVALNWKSGRTVRTTHVHLSTASACMTLGNLLWCSLIKTAVSIQETIASA